MKQIHGGNIYRHRGLIDFSANINPLGAPNEVIRAAVDSVRLWDRYPDPDCAELVLRIAEHEKISGNRIAAGNGAADLIYRIVHAVKPKKALICAPTFGEYKKALLETGCKTDVYYLLEENGFGVYDDILDRIDTAVDIMFLCSPNNPTGRMIQPELLKKIADKCSECGVYLVCDECFLGFVIDGNKYSLSDHLQERGIILKAFTKMFAVPGLRIGYAVCGDETTAELIRQSGQFWSVSVPAQAAGIAALSCFGFEKKTARYVENERKMLVKALCENEIDVFDSSANFIMLKSNNDLFDAMKKKGFLIRDLSGMEGLKKGFYRIAVRTHEENIKFTEALKWHIQ